MGRLGEQSLWWKWKGALSLLYATNNGEHISEKMRRETGGRERMEAGGELGVKETKQKRRPRKRGGATQ